MGFLGGMNLHDPVSATRSGKDAWRDQHARIDGEPVRRLQRLFLENWTYSGGKFVLDLESVKLYFPPAKEQRGKAVQILGDLSLPSSPHWAPTIAMLGMVERADCTP